MADERAELPEPILNFRKRPEEEEEEKVEASPAQKEKGGVGPAPDASGKPFHWEITLTPTLLTTNSGMVELTTKVQGLIEEIVRGILKDKGTPISHPVVIGYINMHGGCEQIKQIFRPQQVQMSPQQIEELKRQMAGPGGGRGMA